jgi:hypothetical protein
VLSNRKYFPGLGIPACFGAPLDNTETSKSNKLYASASIGSYCRKHGFNRLFGKAPFHAGCGGNGGYQIALVHGFPEDLSRRDTD